MHYDSKPIPEDMFPKRIDWREYLRGIPVGEYIEAPIEYQKRIASAASRLDITIKTKKINDDNIIVARLA